MSRPIPLAHVTSDGRTHDLHSHLAATASKARDFAEGFGAGEWAYLAGLWHDLGKYSPDFQRKIRAAASTAADAHIEAKARVNHSTAGAIHAVEACSWRGRIIAYLAAGHHAGLPDWHADEIGASALSQRLRDTSLLQRTRLADIPDAILNHPLPSQKPKPGCDPAFWIRMLFSCLVDADFLDTEAFFDPDKASLRGQYPLLSDLLAKFKDYMRAKTATAPDTHVNLVRSRVLDRCISEANTLPGTYSLTVPTGGGKTLSSMAFALHHAVAHAKRRIIYVIPYTSIIEQTADQFREIFGNSVIEHHSNLDSEDDSKDTAMSRLACENWDAPVIVTTSVQFFESLFAARTSRSRKLHNIANSVVILDEAQMLPPNYLRPILHTLRELVRFYGVTLLLCTATQPALQTREGFEGLDNVREIMEDPTSLHASLKRVTVHVPEHLDTPCEWAQLAESLLAHESVLCIVNRRDDARLLWSLMPEGTIHLSALMCGAHRSKVIAKIRADLHAGKPIRVISTQLVEAGVDLDFPVVYRALAGLDSIAQAAGRCNREGLLHHGDVHVFVPPKPPPPGLLRQTEAIGRSLLESDNSDPIAPVRFTDFFRQLYWLRGDTLDSKGILQYLAPNRDLYFYFRTAAEKLHLIEETAYAPVIVRYGDSEEYTELLARTGPEGWLLRKLQRYVVNLSRYHHTRLLASATIRQIAPGIFVQDHPTLYDEKIGLCTDKAAVYEPDDLIL